MALKGLLHAQEPMAVKVQRFYRPEDISREQGYRAGFWDVYASSETEEVDFDDIIGGCRVLPAGSAGGDSLSAWALCYALSGKGSLAESCTGPTVFCM
jgi:hypothetical protein